MTPSENELKLIAGKLKIAVSIRLLAGGSYLDLVPLFGVSSSHLYNIFEQFLQWIISTLEFPLVAWLRQGNWTAIQALADAFAEKSDGIFYGPFGALDGLAVRIRGPSIKVVPDPGNYYCRKGFYALNVQAICDRWKRFLWVYPSNKGSTHDSAAFGGSRLLELLNELSEEFQKGACSLLVIRHIPCRHFCWFLLINPTLCLKRELSTKPGMPSISTCHPVEFILNVPLEN